MTCDNMNGKLDCLANNNNVTVGNGTTPKQDHLSNGCKANGRTEVPQNEEIASQKSLIILLTIFVTSIGAMCYIYKNFPELEE